LDTLGSLVSVATPRIGPSKQPLADLHWPEPFVSVATPRIGPSKHGHVPKETARNAEVSVATPRIGPSKPGMSPRTKVFFPGFSRDAANRSLQTHKEARKTAMRIVSVATPRIGPSKLIVSGV